jgi:hypothetical protein
MLRKPSRSRRPAVFHPLLLVPALALATLALSAAPALAGLAHPFLSQLTGTPTGPGGAEEPFGLVRDVAVDHSNQDVYVLEDGALDIFSSAGKYESQITGVGVPSCPLAEADSIAFSETTGDLYVATSFPGVVYVFNALGICESTITGSETPSGAFGATGQDNHLFVAVDNSATSSNKGDVYVTDQSDGVVDRFSPAGKYESQLTGFTYPAVGLAVDSSGEVYVADYASKAVDEFSSAGAKIGEITGTPGCPLPEPFSVAVDSAENLYVGSDAEPSGVDEFDSSHTCVAQTAGTPDAPFSPVWGVAVNAAGDMYVAELGKDVNGSREPGLVSVFGPPTLMADVKTGAASSVSDTSESIAGTVDPEGTATTYQFEYGRKGYGESGQYGSVSPASPGVVGDDSSIHTLSAGLTGLTPDTIYHYRIIANNAKGAEGGTSYGSDGSFRTAGVKIGEQSASASSASAQLSAQVNDLGTASTYFFEYSTGEGCFASESCPKTPVEPLAAVEGYVSVSAHVEGLQPHTLYYYRVVVNNVFAGGVLGQSFAEPPVDFSTLALGFPGLPDGRVFEMVTPPNNESADVSVPFEQGTQGERGNTNSHGTDGTEARSAPFQAAAGGDAVTYAADPTTGGNGREGENQYLATRGPEGGWTQVNVQPAGLESAGYEAFSPELSLGVLSSAEPLFEGAPMNETYTTSPASVPATYQLLDGGSGFDGANAGTETVPAFSHVLTGGVGGVLADATGGRLLTVSVLPGDEETVADAVFGAPQVIEPREDQAVLDHAISAEGNRIFWTDLSPGPDQGHLYVRENDSGSDPVTVPVSTGSALFWTASADGAYVFYTEGEKLWRFDVEGEAREELAGEHADVQGVVGTSEDGEYVYFAAGGVLGDGAAKGAAPQTCVLRKPYQGKGTPCNLYLRHDGETSFIVTLPPGAESYGGPGEPGFGVWQQSLADRSAQVSADGSSLVFSVPAENAKYPHEELYDFHPGDMVYLYTAESDSHPPTLTCVSCSPSVEVSSVGPAPRGVGASGGYLTTATNSPANASSQPRVITADGDRVFFDSDAKLVPQDENGLQDVYEWERDGSGSCETSPGCVYLLSGGRSAAQSSLLDASASGNDVFVITRAQLTPQDEDDNFNVFDARVGGVQPVVKEACSEAGCQGVPPAPPIFATPASATFNGTGNYPSESPPPPPKKVVTKTLTRAQKLAQALKVCKRDHKKSKRQSCERTARKKFSAKAKKSKRKR